uniref:Formaldehyde activating enzyme n=1 Tax=uncultured bacterium A1Q1_fos_515 TaxID=1256581 RepID=L7VYT2_9BACT|nr:formaldehyde activating enzyme [uncultured bacterium A1Q1_fos_515]
MTPQYGEGFAGAGAHVAHVNTVLGSRDGPVGTAWATALATPTAGHAPFVVVHSPGLPVAPFTLFVNKAAIAGERHGRLTWGAAQAGVASGVVDALEGGLFARWESLGTVALIAAVWVDPAATEEELVYANNRNATLAAVTMGVAGGPDVDALLAAGDPANPYFRR